MRTTAPDECQYKNLEHGSKLEVSVQNISKVEGGTHGLSQRFQSVVCVEVMPDEQEKQTPEREVRAKIFSELMKFVETKYKFGMEFSSCFAHLLPAILDHHQYWDTQLQEIKESQNNRVIDV